jgi:hypothetical protein
MIPQNSGWVQGGGLGNVQINDALDGAHCLTVLGSGGPLRQQFIDSPSKISIICGNIEPKSVDVQSCPSHFYQSDFDVPMSGLGKAAEILRPQRYISLLHLTHWPQRHWVAESITTESSPTILFEDAQSQGWMSG